MNSLHHVINLVRRLRGTELLYFESPLNVSKDDFFPITVRAIAAHPEQPLLYIMAQDYEWYAVNESPTDGVIVKTLCAHLDENLSLYEQREVVA